MLTTLTTPLLDAALQTDPRLASRFHRWVNAKATLVESIATQHIWNVDFVDAKDTLSRGIDEVMRQVYAMSLSEYRRVRELNIRLDNNWDLQQRTYKAHVEFCSSCQMNQAAGRIKRLAKFMDLANVPHYVEVLKEVVLLHEAVQAVKPFIEKGRKPSETAVEIDLTHTGECPICCRTQKLTANRKMVHHGFEISGGSGHYYGYRRGSCFGVGYPPSELSCEANIAYIPVLERALAETRKHLAMLNGNEYESHSVTGHWREGIRMVPRTVEYARGTKEYAKVNESMIREAESHIRGYEEAIEAQKHLVSVWKPRPLYDDRHA